MSPPDDPRVEIAKDKAILDIADKLKIDGLRRAGVEMVGPCPVCGGRDRFAINPVRGMFNCRMCGGKGDVIALVRHVKGCSFKDALHWLCGEAALELDDAARAALREKAKANKKKADAYAAGCRRRAIADALAIWNGCAGNDMGAVRDYFARRGLSGPLLDNLPKTLRFAPHHPYIRKGAPKYSGPAMIAEVLSPAGQLVAVHQTWLDLTSANGKASIIHPDTGEVNPAKLVRGSKKGGAIRLNGNALTTPDTLIMGEGIETTLSARAADVVPGAVYWAGVDLGNMAGRMRHVPNNRYSGVPDMADDSHGFVPPAWVKRLIFIVDGDSDPKATRAKCTCGLRRAMALRPGLKAELVAATPGQDLNDMLRGGDNA